MISLREPDSYVGRFAPSPTGPLHFGSLLAAVASYLQAKKANGTWLLRIEDIDPPREQVDADSLILAALEAYGFEWDGPVIYQSRSAERHQTCIDELLATGLAYPCSCSRRDLANAPDGPLGKIYPGTCRSGGASGEAAIRIRIGNQDIRFVDGLQGRLSQDLARESGDFVIQRRDGLIAYHLAVTVDDADQNITEIVRGIDLLDSTPRQIFLQQTLGFVTPGYLHIPVVLNQQGQKLSKLTGAQGIPLQDPGPILVAALAALRQPMPPNLHTAELGDIWAWATEHWNPGVLKGVAQINAVADAMA